MLPGELFHPGSVAVVGASRNPEKVGYGVFANLVQAGFRGKIYGVNPGGGELFGHPLYPSIDAIPGPVDLGVFVVAPNAILEGIPRLAAKGMRAGIVISAGFKEIGGAGVALERSLREAATSAGVRVLGPNCLGLIDTHSLLNASFSRGTPPKGFISFFSQSGALATAVLDWAIGRNIGFSKFVSLGNKVDISESDILEYLADDPLTRVILGYVESIDDGRRFLRAARHVTPRKPVIIVKAGATAAGARAASSHTGSLAGSDPRLRGGVPAGRGAPGGDGGGSLRPCPRIRDAAAPTGDRLLILTNAGWSGDPRGGHGGAARHSPRRGLRLPSGADPSRGAAHGEPGEPGGHHRGRPRGPVQDRPLGAPGRAVGRRRPRPADAAVDDGAGGDRESDRFRLRRLRQDRARLLPRRGNGGHVAPDPQRRRRPQLRGTRACRADPFRDASILPHPVGGRAGGGGGPVGPPENAERLVGEALAGGRRALGEEESRGILEAYGFTFPRHAFAGTSDAAVAAYREMGCASAAMKIVSPQISHKTDVGGVRLGLRGEEDVARAFMEITSSVRRLAPSAWIAGVSIQEMVTGGRELIVGMSRDPQFGPLLMFGLGGIYVEVLKDVSFRVAPVSRRDAEEMVREIRAWPLLAAYRGSEPADEDAIVEALIRVSRLSCDFPEIQELDINPLLVLPKGKGIRAIDCRMTITEAP